MKGGSVSGGQVRIVYADDMQITRLFLEK